MNEDHQDWDKDLRQRMADQPIDALLVDVGGFEGPLDLLLELARKQKVDIAKISILTLAEQYLAFIDRMRDMRLELAADYLVMAAWLAFLKSKLLLPEPESEEEESGEDLAQILAFRLKRLEAMRQAAASLMNRDRLGRDVFARGRPEPVAIVKTSAFSATLYDLLTAYAMQRQRQSVSVVHVHARKVWSLKEAREVLQRLIGASGDWTRLDRHLLDYMIEPDKRASVLASSFSASLELVREGAMQIRQEKAFAPIYMRRASKEAP